MSALYVNNVDLTDAELTLKHQHLVAECHELKQQLNLKLLAYRIVEAEISKRPTLRAYDAAHIGR